MKANRVKIKPQCSTQIFTEADVFSVGLYEATTHTEHGHNDSGLPQRKLRNCPVPIYYPFTDNPARAVLAASCYLYCATRPWLDGAAYSYNEILAGRGQSAIRV